MYALLNHADAEAKLAELPVVGDVTAELGLCYLVLAAGLVQGLMGTKTNWARKAYVSATAPSGGPPRSLSCRPQDVPWPHTVAPEKNKDKLRFDAVQRAHLNFVENYPQFLGVAFFALKIAPKLATVCGTLFLLGRFAPYARLPIPPSPCQLTCPRPQGRICAGLLLWHRGEKGQWGVRVHARLLPPVRPVLAVVLDGAQAAVSSWSGDSGGARRDGGCRQRRLRGRQSGVGDDTYTPILI